MKILMYAVLAFMPYWAVALKLKLDREWELIQNKYLRVAFMVAWFDFWIGVYYDQRKGCWFVMLPMVGFVVTFYKRHNNSWVEKWKKKFSQIDEAEAYVERLKTELPNKKKKVIKADYGTAEARILRNLGYL